MLVGVTVAVSASATFDFFADRFLYFRVNLIHLLQIILEIVPFVINTNVIKRLHISVKLTLAALNGDLSFRHAVHFGKLLGVKSHISVMF
jgi:hypothetical protein